MKLILSALVFTLIFCGPAIADTTNNSLIKLTETPLQKMVRTIAEADTKKLSELGFFELNILKNALFSSQGYAYAKDRQWLYDYFYNSVPMKRRDTNQVVDLADIVFPKANKTNQIEANEVFQMAVAKVQVALIWKLRTFKEIGDIYKSIDTEYNKTFRIFYSFRTNGFRNDYVGMVFYNRSIRYLNRICEQGPDSSYNDYLMPAFKESLKREIAGYNRFVRLLDQDDDYDPSEFLGLYIGTVQLLQAVIEARNGRIFDGSLGWEIRQLIGETPARKDYRLEDISEKEKDKLDTLQKVIEKIQGSDIGDLPKELKRTGYNLVFYVGC